MRSLAGFELNKAPLYGGIVLTSEQVRDDFPSYSIEGELQRPLRLARGGIVPSWDQERQIKRPLVLFYDEWDSSASQDIYRLSDASRLDKVLANRQESTVSLGVILLWTARHLALPAVPVIFPTQMLLRVDPGAGEEMWLVNPFNGETLNRYTLEVRLKDNIGSVVELFDGDLDETGNTEAIRKLLDTLKSALMEERQVELAPRAGEALLQFDPEDPYEIRNRGLIYAQLGCDHMTLLDLSYFVEQCPENPISKMIHAQINTTLHKQIILHQSGTIPVTP